MSNVKCSHTFPPLSVSGIKAHNSHRSPLGSKQHNLRCNLVKLHCVCVCGCNTQKTLSGICFQWFISLQRVRRTRWFWLWIAVYQFWWVKIIRVVEKSGSGKEKGSSVHVNDRRNEMRARTWRTTKQKQQKTIKDFPV